jgi:5-methyltetrahydropteroyltriglutamate--homocysteine methyltransferase
MKTTVIGSIPVVGEGNEAIRTAVNDQLEAGIDIISDGQTRKDMVAYYADHIPGFKVEDGRTQIVGKIKPPEETPLSKDLVFAKNLARGRAEVKAIITGPVTMIFFSELSPTAPYHGFRDDTLYRDVAGALAVEADLIQSEGFFYFQIDEPSFSIGAPMSLAKAAIEETISGIRGTKALHVCGNLKRTFTDIVKIDGLDVLSLAFKDYVSNFDTVERKIIEDYSKKIGVGCVSSLENNVESIDIIRGLVYRALNVYGVENIAWIHPDCGQRALERDAVRSKLKNMVQALKSMEAEIK